MANIQINKTQTNKAQTYTLKTKNTYNAENIDVNITVQDGSCVVSGGGLSKGTASGGALSGGTLSAGAGTVSVTTKPKVTISETGTFTTTGKTYYGVTTTRPSGIDGTNYLTINDSHSSTAGEAAGSGTVSRSTITRSAFSQAVTRAAVTDTDTAGWISSGSRTAIAAGTTTVTLSEGSIASSSCSSNSATTSIGVDITDDFEPYYQPIVTTSVSGGDLSGGGLSAGDGSCSYYTGSNVTVSDNDNGIYVKFAGSGSVSRATITRAAVTETNSAGAIAAQSATKMGATTIAPTSGSSNTGYATKYITGVTVPASTTFTVSAAGVSEGTIKVNAYDSSGTSSGLQQIVTSGKWITTTVTPATTSLGPYYGKVVVNAMSSGSLSADAGSASAGGNISLGASTTTQPSSGYYISATGSGSVKVGTSGYLAANTSKSSNAKTVYYPVTSGTITNNTSGGSSSGTINRGNQIKIGAGYYSSDCYYTAQANSGTITITAAGTTSCNGYANVYVATGALGTVSASKSVSGNTATITPSISAGTAGYSAHGSKTGSAVTVTAAEVCNSGTLTLTTPGTATCTGYSNVYVNIAYYTDLS